MRFQQTFKQRTPRGSRHRFTPPPHMLVIISFTKWKYNKISFKKEGLPSCSECFYCFVRHLGTFVNDSHNWYTVSRIRSLIAWVIDKNAMHCDTMLEYYPVLIAFMNECLVYSFLYKLATSLTLNIEKYCNSYLNGLADLWCLRGRCLPKAFVAKIISH